MKLNMFMNVNWKVLYQSRVFDADRNSKMAATVEHSLTLDPMGNTLKDLLLGNDYDS